MSALANNLIDIKSQDNFAGNLNESLVDDPTEMLPSDLLAAFVNGKLRTELPHHIAAALMWLQNGDVPIALQLLDAYDADDAPVVTRKVADAREDFEAYLRDLRQIVHDLKAINLQLR